MRAVFFGTPPAAVPGLVALAEVADIELVVTRPDKPRGRSNKPVAPAVAEAARYFGFRLAQPAKAAEVAAELAGVDVAVVVAYGQILPGSLLEIPHSGFVNVHFSVLPRWRGAAPVAAAIRAGDRTTGVSLMQIDEGLDTGPVYAVVETAIADSETTGAVTARLAAAGARLLGQSLPGIVDGSISAQAQDDELATAAPRIQTTDAEIDHATPAQDAARMIRAYNPSPGAWLTVDGQRVKIWQAHARAQTLQPPGELANDDEEVVLGLGDGELVLEEVQPAGKGRMTAAAWAHGWHGPKRLG